MSYKRDLITENYPYRIRGIIAGLVALVIAVLTVTWQVLKAATTNPVSALRYE